MSMYFCRRGNSSALPRGNYHGFRRLNLEGETEIFPVIGGE